MHDIYFLNALVKPKDQTLYNICALYLQDTTLSDRTHVYSVPEIAKDVLLR